MAQLCDSCRCDAVEEERHNGGDTAWNAVCLGGLRKIWIYSAVVCFKCSAALDFRSLCMGKSSSNS